MRRPPRPMIVGSGAIAAAAGRSRPQPGAIHRVGPACAMARLRGIFARPDPELPGGRAHILRLRCRVRPSAAASAGKGATA